MSVQKEVGGSVMSRGMRQTTFGKKLLGLMLVVVLVGLALLATVCEELSTGAPSTASAEIPITVTTVTQPASTESVYGTWEGTYTVLAVWDRNGAVNNPPVPPGASLAMQLVLHPLSGASGDYGTVDIPGFGSSRVTDILQERASVQLSVVSEASGRADTHSIFTLSLEGDILTGVDSGDPAVPSGWVTTSGTIVLTRTGSWSAAEGAGAGSGATQGGTGSSGGASTGDSFTEMSLLLGPILAATTTTTREPQTFNLSKSDDGHTVGMRVGDSLHIVLNPSTQDDVAHIWWRWSVSLQFSVSPREIKAMGNIVLCYVDCEAFTTGPNTLTAIFEHSDGTRETTLTVHVHVVE
jgi:hypothetical protein